MKKAKNFDLLVNRVFIAAGVNGHLLYVVPKTINELQCPLYHVHGGSAAG